MGNIKVLSEVVANKIAAGEVIERPASIVKELVENSLDAKATKIHIEIKNGGRSLIRVVDNGSGMNREDAELSLKRHATSKIEEAEDLNHIHSFGFRGEALPSIGAVSRLDLFTRTAKSSEGTHIQVEGGKQADAKESPAQVGTTIEIRDLFFNTPARRKFLRTDTTELGHIQDVVTQLALANPSVAFSLKSSKRTLFDLLPSKDLFGRVKSLWNEDQVKYLLPFEGEGGGIKVRGVMGKPYLNRGNRSDQTFFVNGRWVKSVGFSYSLQDGYHGLLMHGQYPVAIVFIDLDPERVDVNVHPTKQEVRISQEKEVRSLLKRTVAETLQEAGELAPSMTAPSFDRSGFQNTPAVPQGRATITESFLQEEQAYLSKPSETLPVSEPEPQFVNDVQAVAEPISFRDELKVTKILGQIHHTFIVAETEEGMILIDQHAAHEKVMYEALVAEFEKQQPAMQGLLMDEVIELPLRQREIMNQSLPFLKKLGFEIEDFGENDFVVRSVPAALREKNVVQLLKYFVEQKEAGKGNTDLSQYREEIAALFACKRKSVKAHEPMTMVAMQSLMKQLAQCENPYQCPHGRPAFFKYSFNDLEKMFKRK